MSDGTEDQLPLTEAEANAVVVAVAELGYQGTVVCDETLAEIRGWGIHFSGNIPPPEVMAKAVELVRGKRPHVLWQATDGGIIEHQV